MYYNIFTNNSWACLETYRQADWGMRYMHRVGTCVLRGQTRRDTPYNIMLYIHNVFIWEMNKSVVTY